MPPKGTWIEQVDKRTRNGKKRVDSADPRHFAVDVSIGSIHYKDNPQDEAEQWEKIDNIFEPTSAPWDWEMLKADYHVRVIEDFTAGQIIEFEKQGEVAQFQPMALEWTNDLDQIQPISMPQEVTPVITNPEVDLLPVVGMPSHQGTIKWNDGYGEGIDFEWKCTSTRLVKTLEVENLNKLPVPEQYILDGGNPVLRLNLIFDPSSNIDIYVDGIAWDKKKKIQTFNVIRFQKSGGGNLWGFMPLLFWGSNPELEENRGQSVATLEKRGNKLHVSIRVPYNWLQNATYPIFIDQTVEVFPDYYRYFHADAWDGDLKWLTSEPDGAAPASSVSPNLNQVNDYLIQGFATEPLSVDSLSAGGWGFYLWGKHDGTTLKVSFFVEVRKNSSTGDLLATTNYTPNLSSAEMEHYCYLDFPQTAWSSGDKIWVGVYAHVTTKQAGTYAYFYYDHSSRLSRTLDPTVDEQVGNNADDGARWAATGFSATNATDYLGYTVGGGYNTFHRWTGVSIEGTIGTSYMELYRYVVGNAKLRVYGVDQDNPAAPTSAGEWDADPLTDEFADDWDGDWGAAWNQSPSLTAIFQELVNSYTISNDAVMVQVLDDASDDVYVQISQHERATGGEAAKLHIEYTAVAVPRHGFVNFQDPGIV